MAEQLDSMASAAQYYAAGAMDVSFVGNTVSVPMMIVIITG